MLLEYAIYSSSDVNVLKEIKSLIVPIPIHLARPPRQYSYRIIGNSCRADIDKNTAVQRYQEDIRGLLDAANPIFRNMRCTSMTLGGQALSWRAICSS